MGDSYTCSKIRYKRPYLREHTPTPSSYCSKKSWSQIPGWVNSVTTVESESGANDEHNQTNHDGYWAFVRSIVTLIDNGEDAANQQGCPKHLRNVLTHTSPAILSRIPWNTTRLSAWLPFCLSICRFACFLSITSLPVYMRVCLPVCLSTCQSVCLSVSLPVSVSLYVSALLPAYPLVVLLVFNQLG